ncbi:MAG: cytochrome P450, partial [Proteobacteria bacterium]|nr:cytochrome P450 [Pseudomonadota bacterium]
AKGSFDFASEVACQIPSSVLADLYGIREEDRENFYLWSDTMTQFFGGSSSYQNEDGIRVNEAAKNLREFFEALIADRRSQPQDDFVSKMLERQDGLGLSDDEVVSQAIMMLVAGQVTTSDQICNNMFGLLSDDRARAIVQSNLNIMQQALEELTRLDPAVTFIFRVVGADTLIGSQEVKAGDVVFISNHAANRDSREFYSPDAFDPMVVRSAHLGYGYGPHYCLGASLARIEMELLFRKMFTRFPQLSLDPKKVAVRKHHSLSFSGFESLPLRINHHG